MLGIETSCDETAAAMVRRDADGSGTILSSVVRSQLDLHAVYGGVVPEIAARAHVEMLDAAILPGARRGRDSASMRIDAIAATAGPGLIGGLIVGVTTGKAIALGRGVPFIAVNHLEAHALTAGLTDRLGFPYLLLLVSGGHTQLLIVKDVGAMSGSALRSTMRSARRSTRPPSCSVSAIPAARRWKLARREAAPPSSCPARCLDGPSRISRLPA